MKKIFKLILLLIITFILVVPQNTQAASAPWVWSTKYRQNLELFLTNWKGASNPSGCWRSTTIVDPPGCLSMSKIGDILVQLDNDNYFKMKNPTDRRNYLMNTPHQVYVMKKVVMYYEQVLNPNTIVYWADQTPAQNFTEGALAVKFMYQGMKDSFIQGDSLAASFDGDEQAIWSLAFIQTGVSKDALGTYPIYTLRNKQDLTQSALDQIFNTTRMSPYVALKNQIANTANGWTTDESNALWGTMRAQTAVLNYADRKNITPTMAKIEMNSMQMAIGSLGGGGLSKVGGLTMMEGVSASEISGYTAKVGSVSFDISSNRIPFYFAGSQLRTTASSVHGVLSDIESSANMVLKQAKFYNPNFITDQYLASAVWGDISVQAQKEFASGGWGVSPTDDLWGFYHSQTKQIFIADEAFTTGYGDGKALTVHELLHKIRYESIPGFKELYPNLNEVGTDNLTSRILSAENEWNPGITARYTYRIYWDTLANKLAQLHPDRFPSSYFALNYLDGLLLQGRSFSELDTFITKKEGVLSFSQALENKLGYYQSLEKAYQKAPSGALANQLSQQETVIFNFILQ